MRRSVGITLILTLAGGAACKGDTRGAFQCTPERELAVIVYMAAPVNPVALASGSKRGRSARLAAALADHAGRTQAEVLRLLRARGAGPVVSLPIANALAVRVPAEMVDDLRRRPDVARVTLDEVLSAPDDGVGTTGSTGWNLQAIAAPRLWEQGARGAGVVVANMDTGVDVTHPDLAPRWRGGTGSWFDPFDHTTLPFDPIGHGTQTMGLVVGGVASGDPVGVAPEAQWIAARVYDASGRTTTSVLHQAFQWLLDPDGDPGTDDAPQVVSASWGDAPGTCNLEFQGDIEALKAAGIVVVFAAGNSGPLASSDVSPANGPASFAAGAVDRDEGAATFSARGPSSCDGRAFPDLVAPGVSVRTTDVTLGGAAQYAFVSGTSFAAPHVAGAAALLLGARPDLSPGDIEELLRRTSKDLGAAGLDDTYGHGLLDVAAAYNALAVPPAVRIEPLSIAQVGVPYRTALRLTGATATRWTVSEGALPDGLLLEAGVLSGTPDQTGAFTFGLVAETPIPVAQNMTLTVLPAAEASPRCGAQ